MKNQIFGKLFCSLAILLLAFLSGCANSPESASPGTLFNVRESGAVGAISKTHDTNKFLNQFRRIIRLLGL